MLDKSHVDVAGQQREFDCAQLVESPALAAAARGDGFIPNRSYSFAQRRVLDLHQAGKEFRDFVNAVVGSLGRCHGGDISFFVLVIVLMLMIDSLSIMITSMSRAEDSNLVGNASRGRPVVAVIDWINSTHRFLAGLLFDHVRYKARGSRDHENAVESRGIHF